MVAATACETKEKKSAGEGSDWWSLFTMVAQSLPLFYSLLRFLLLPSPSPPLSVTTNRPSGVCWLMVSVLLFVRGAAIPSFTLQCRPICSAPHLHLTVRRVTGSPQGNMCVLVCKPVPSLLFTHTHTHFHFTKKLCFLLSPVGGLHLCCCKVFLVLLGKRTS